MANWKMFKITEKEAWNTHAKFHLDGYIDYADKMANYIFLPYHDGTSFSANRNYQVGDCLEVDLDIVKFENSFFDIKYGIRGKWHAYSNSIYSPSSSAVVPSSSALVPSSSSNQQMTTSQFWEIGNRMMDRAERSGGEYEAAYTAQEEQRTDGSVFRQASWVYRKKN